MTKRKTQGQRRKRSKGNSYQVFVSHATLDKWIAKTICEKIESVGATTFRDDRDIDGGDDIPESIKTAIQRSSEFVVLITPTSWDRAWVLIEVGVAWGWPSEIRIVPILYHVETDRIPPIIKQKKAYTLNDFDDYLKELAKRVKEKHV